MKLIKSSFKILLNYIKIIYSIIFIFFIYLISFKKKFYIGFIKTKSLGTFSTSMEVFKYECLEKKISLDDFTILWFRSQNIANKVLFEKYFHDQIVLPGYFLRPVYDFCIKYNFLKKKFIAPYRSIDKNYKKNIILKKEDIWNHRDIHDVLIRNKPYIKFSKEEIEIGENFLNSKGVRSQDKFVCFGSRGKKFKGEDVETIRNGKITNQIKTMNFLTSKDYKVFRMGRNEDQKLECANNKLIIDYAFDEHKSDLLDLYIFSKCDFLISGNSGLNTLATLFRKQKLVVDFAGFNEINTENDKYISLIVPKIYRRTGNNELVKFSEVFEKNLEPIAKVEDIKELGYFAEYTSENEILEATKEFLNSKNLDTSDDYDEQKSFWKLVNEYSPHASNFKICKSFFNKYCKIFC